MTVLRETLAASLNLASTATAVAGLAAAGLAWAWHIWRLRTRERELLALVERRTREWQDEAREHARLRARQTAAALPVPAADAGARVLVVSGCPGERERLASALTGLPVAPAFADSAWAALVAADDASASGAAYEVVLLAREIRDMEASALAQCLQTRLAPGARFMVLPEDQAGIAGR